MSGLFGGGNEPSVAEKEAVAQRKEARAERQTSNEEEMRARQQAERSGGGGAPSNRRGRTMLIGKLSSALTDKLGG